MQLALKSGEVLVHQGSAKYQNQPNKLMNEGQLYLTNSRLIFIDDHEDSQVQITLKEIQSLKKCWVKEFGVVPLFENQMKIQTSDKECNFVLESPGYWTDLLRA